MMTVRKHISGWALIVLPLILASSEALCSVIGSPHDLYSQGYLSVEAGDAIENPQCLDCHFPEPVDDRPMLWQVTPPSIEEYGQVGNMCFSCHDGVSMVDRNVDSALTVYHPDSHGLRTESAPPETDFSNMGLPFITDGRVRCITCHEPHLQTYRPFLRVPVVGICSRCHLERRHEGFGVENATGSHPVSIEPFDTEGGPSPIEVQDDLSVPFPVGYPKEKGALRDDVHWSLGGHLGLGDKGRVECVTCHAIHGNERTGPSVDLLARDPVRRAADELCEGCHRGERGDGEEDPPFPNPGGTILGRTYHPADDDIANGEGLILEMPEIEDLRKYRMGKWGEVDPDTEYPRVLCTTCHTAHGGMEYSPALVEIDEDLTNDQGVTTFCETCHWYPPEGHHGYGVLDATPGSGSAITIPLSIGVLGSIWGTPEPGVVYCSHCHRAHNAGYGANEADYIPILNDSGIDSCSLCHILGVSHFMGDPTLPSTYNKPNPPLKRDMWPYSGNYSFYEGTGDSPTTVTCRSCHDRVISEGGSDIGIGGLLAPAGEEVEWTPGYPEEYLCTGCHGESPATIGGGITHPLVDADSYRFPTIHRDHLLPGETPASYTDYGGINCHSCHRAHGAAVEGGVYILKVVRGDNTDPKAIRPKIESDALCYSCHPAGEY